MNFKTTFDGMLFLIGLGLDVGDVSTKAISAIRASSEVYIEKYTTPIRAEYLKFIKEETGREPIELTRSSLEEDIANTISRSKSGNISILVSGDPLIATTHHTIIERAKKLGIRTAVFHAASIFSSAIGESGLDIYKFGPTTTIPFWSEKYRPVSFLDVIKRNLDNKEHTLVLLDVTPESNRSMGIKEALDELERAEKERNYGIIRPDMMLLVLEDIGTSSQKISYSRISDLRKRQEGKEPNPMKSAIIIPTSLTFAEEEILNAIKTED